MGSKKRAAEKGGPRHGDSRHTGTHGGGSSEGTKRKRAAAKAKAAAVTERERQPAEAAVLMYYSPSSACPPHVARCVPCALHVLSLHKVL
jgi:hypothetical protein